LSIICLAGPLIVLLSLPDLGLVHYLVHIATSGIEAAQPGAVHRLGNFPDQRSEGFRLFWIALTASGVVFLASAFIIFANCASAERRTLKAFSIGGFLVSLTIAASYCVWYYKSELPRVSIDLASVGVASNWLEWISGAVIALFFITAGAVRLSLRDSPILQIANSDTDVVVPAMHESILCLLALSGAAAIYTFEIVRVYSSPFFTFFPSGWGSVFETVASLFRDPPSLLMMLIGILGLQLCWLRWRRRAHNVDWSIRALDQRRFVWNSLGLALLVLVGVPTLSSYCFVYWLGPWYLYGE
jgi:hypothetical protein